MITLGGMTLPDGLRWGDELDSSPVEQSIDFTLTGAQVVQQSARLGGRPITLIGGIRFVRLPYSDAQALYDLLNSAPVQGLTLVLHDGREFQVKPRFDGSGPLIARQVPRVLDSGVANPQPDTPYWIDRIRLQELADGDSLHDVTGEGAASDPAGTADAVMNAHLLAFEHALIGTALQPGNATTQLNVPEFTTATAPDAANVPSGTLIYVSDGEWGNPVIAIALGGQWRRLSLGDVINDQPRADPGDFDDPLADPIDPPPDPPDDPVDDGRP